MPSQALDLDLDVLVIDDERNIRRTLRVCLEALGCLVDEAANAPAVRAAQARKTYDVALLDLRLGPDSGLDLLPAFLATNAGCDVIVMTAFGSIETAVEAIRRGACDYLTKPLTPARIQEVLERVAARRTLDAQIRSRRTLLGKVVPEPGLQTSSPRMSQLLELLARAAASDSPVLLQGEKGTGKSVLARRLHALSPRAAAPFAVIRCGALLREGTVDELIREASIGTLFLDQIEALPRSLQERLAQPLESRVVAATHLELEREVRAGRFCQELFERLQPVVLAVPPLRERKEDILPMSRRWLAFYSQHGPVRSPELTPDAESALSGYGWPGNIPELRLAMERAAILRGGLRVGPEALPERVVIHADRVPSLGGEFTMEAVEREHVLRVLHQASTQEEASRILGMDVSTLWRKRKRYGV